MVHMRNGSVAKTYVPLTGFSERPAPVLPSWAVNRTKGASRGPDLQQRAAGGAWSKSATGVKVYQPSYFYVSSMRKKALPPGARPDGGRRGLVGTGGGEEGGGYSPRVLPRVTGTAITPMSPRSAAAFSLEESGYDNLDSASMLGTLEYPVAGTGGGTEAPVAFRHAPLLPLQATDAQSVTTLDGQSVLTDHTVEERSVTLPFQVTFTKAPPRSDSRRASSPKSVRFRLPSREAAAVESQLEDGQQPPPPLGAQAFSSRCSDGGGSVVDGFFLQPGSHPNQPGGGGPANNDAQPALSSVSGVGSVSSQASSGVCATPSTLMRSRGALSNARQVPGRYFPPLALSDDHRFTPTPLSTSGAPPLTRRVGPGSCVSSASAPPALGAANITQMHRGNVIPTFAVVSSHSWSPNNTIPVNPKQGDKVVLQPRTFALGSPGRGRDRGMTMEDINRDSQRDTVYNRNKKSFWEMYDADPGRFTISFREESPSYDPTSFLHSDYYTVRRSCETPVRGSASGVRSVKKNSSPFHGCLEGTTKRLHTKAIPRTFIEP